MTDRTNRVQQLDRRRETAARRRRRVERRPEPMSRDLAAFSRLEALAVAPPPAGIDDGPTLTVPTATGASAEIAEPMSGCESTIVSAPTLLAARDRQPTPRTRSRVGRAVVLSTVGTLATGLLVVEPVAANTTPEAPAPVLGQAPFVAAAVTGLELGSRGDAVRQLQQALLDAGINVGGGADGIFGPQTKASVEQFQAARGLTVTGRVDQATADALAGSTGGSNAGSDGGASTPASTDGYVGLARGASGPLVEDLQRALIDMGVWLPSVNGSFNASTERGLRQFQRWNQLGVTGTVTQAAARVLGLGSASSPASSPSEPDPAPAAPSASEGSSDYVGVTRGSRGPLVADIQRALIERGIAVVGGADGDFGPKTQAALVEFQRANGLSPTGAMSAADVTALGLAGEEPVVAPAAVGFIGLSRGTRGDEVRQLQQSLIQAGVSVAGGADGIFGPKTEEALRSYQTSQGLTTSGVVDEATVARLGLGSDNSPQPFSPGPAEAEAPAEEAPAAESSDNPYVGLSQGSSGPLVLELQRALQHLGFVIIGGADGSFGPATERTLIAFQSVNDIPQRGIVTERGANILALGTGQYDSDTGSGGGSTASFQMERFPVQGRCAFGDTWHAPRGGGRLHVGTDIIADEGKLLYAVVDGTISKLYWDTPGALSGNGLRIAQDDGTYFTYLHMLGFAPGIELGTKVTAGDVIGWIGNTGSSATPHLHFEIHPGGGAAINPYPYLKAIDDCENDTPRYQSSFAPAE